MIVAIAGAGTMGKGIATRALCGGHKVRAGVHQRPEG
jgi:3-hydroxyacyl-CoA dehydrogenase